MAPRARFIETLQAGKPCTILCIGTSNYNSPNQDAPFTGGTWIGQMREELERRFSGKPTVISHGFNGKDIVNGGIVNIAAAMKECHPDVVITGYAFNDAALSDFDAVEKAVREMLRIIREHNPDAEIIFHNFMAAEDVPDYPSRTKRPNHDEMLAIYERIAAEEGLLNIVSVDPWEELRVRDNERYLRLSNEGGHPTSEGNRLITTPLFLRGLGLDVPYEPLV